MANNDYWAYLKNENELKHYRTKISEGGSPNGFRKDGSQPVGQKRKGILDAAGNYIYETGNKIGNAVRSAGQMVGGFARQAGQNIRSAVNGAGKAAGDWINNIRSKLQKNESDPAEAKRVPSSITSTGKGGKRSYDSDRRDELIKAAQEKAKYDNFKKGYPVTTSTGKGGKRSYDMDTDEKMTGEEAFNNYSVSKQKGLRDFYKNNSVTYQRYLQQQAKEEERKRKAAANQAKLDKWGYKD